MTTHILYRYIFVTVKLNQFRANSLLYSNNDFTDISNAFITE